MIMIDFIYKVFFLVKIILIQSKVQSILTKLKIRLYFQRAFIDLAVQHPFFFAINDLKETSTSPRKFTTIQI